MKTKTFAAISFPTLHPNAVPMEPLALDAPALARRSWWLWPHLLSLDAPVVAVAWQSWWERAVKGSLHWHHHLILGLAVWLVYLADRLADVRRNDARAFATERHAFAQRHDAKTQLLLAANVAALGILTLAFLPIYQFIGGIILLAAVGGYFHFAHRVQRHAPALAPKEGLVGALFAGGTSFFALSSGGRVTWPLIAEICLFGVLCFLNCAFITRWERSWKDRRDPSSLLNAYPRLTASLAGVSLAMALLLTLLAFLLRQEAVRVAPLLMGFLGLWTLDRCRRLFSKPLLRVLADVALLGPWVCLWWF